MDIHFYKYQGTGNDFVIIDNIEYEYDLSHFTTERIAFLCNRKYGVGADGVIILDKSDNHDFKMIYYNADGGLSSMCGNGGRCILHLAHHKGYIGEEATFEAIDGTHNGLIRDLVSVQLTDVKDIEKGADHFILDTGSPHYVNFVDTVEDIDIIKLAREIRYNERFKSEGINVNFVAKENGGIKLRTYERGVENETLSCGTGVTASAIAYALQNESVLDQVSVSSMGGELKVSFDYNEGIFTNVWLTGSVGINFEGRIRV